MPHSPYALAEATLPRLDAAIARPLYDRSLLEASLVHIGAGSFNRSHLAVYLDDLLQQNPARGERWAEVGVGIMPTDKDLHEALLAQDCLYGHLQMEDDALSYRIIGSLLRHIFAPSATQSVLAAIADPQCRILSLTVTEGGYFQDAYGNFSLDNAILQHDLEQPASPFSWVGIAAEAAQRRRSTHGQPFTLLSCDNVQGNGKVARRALLGFAESLDPRLARWIESNVSFPASMVDRITPRTTEAHRDLVAARFGLRDKAAVVSESFRQWVIEDEFAAGRPAWESLGVQMTSDVAPYEMTKMRLLNGGHSALGYLADLLGMETIAQAAVDPQLARLLAAFLDEVRPTVPRLPGLNLDEYTASIQHRFANSAIGDQVSRICSEVCAKMARFLAPSLRDLYNSGRSPKLLPLVVAAWLHYLRGTDESGRQMLISDPQLKMLRPFFASAHRDTAAALLPIFGDLPRQHPQFVDTVEADLAQLRRDGVRATLAALVPQVQG